MLTKAKSHLWLPKFLVSLQYMAVPQSKSSRVAIEWNRRYIREKPS